MIKTAAENKTLVKDAFNMVQTLNKFLPIRDKKHEKFYKMMKKEGRYAKEFGTIKISLPRRAGNTALAALLMSKYKKSIYVSCGDHLRDNRINIYDKRFYAANLKDMSDIEAPMVIVDCASGFSDDIINNIYKIDSDLFVFIG
jgi:hypothetical protein